MKIVIKVDDLISAVDLVQKFAQDTKNVPGILLEFNEAGESVKVRYSDGKKAISYDIDCECDVVNTSKIVVNYTQLTQLINNCKSNANIVVREIEMELIPDKKIISIVAEKSIVCDGEDGDVEYKKGGTLKKEINYTDLGEGTGSDLKMGMVTRFDYDGSIFDGEDYDHWDRDKLLGVLNLINLPDAKNCYVLPKKNMAFARGTSTLIYVPFEEDFTYGLSVSPKIVKYIYEILGKINSDTVMVDNMDKKYCRIISEDRRLGIWFEMTDGNNADVNTLVSYTKEELKYNSYKLLLNKFMVADAIKSALSTDKNEQAKLKFRRKEDEVELYFNNSLASNSNNSFEVVVERLTGEREDIEELQLDVNISTLLGLVTKVDTPIVAIDIDISVEKYAFVRISNVTGVDDNMNTTGSFYQYTAYQR